MKASELRIGNYFVWSGFASMGQGQDVVGFNNIGYHNLMEPIPITPEWLERFGFKKREPDYVSDKPYFSIQLLKGMADFLSIRVHGEVFEDTFYWSKIKYVHQLQNLYFALTGEELTIKEPVEK